MWRALTIALGFASVAATGIGAEQGGQQQLPQAKNILVIVLDDVGTDKLSFYGETPPSTPPILCPDIAPTSHVESYANTPRLNKLRQSGILFNSAYANPVCSPTRSCILTGRYAFRTGIGMITNAGTSKLADTEVLIPELLRDGFSNPYQQLGLPYKRAAFGKWHLTYLSGNESHATDNGFQFFSGSISNVDAFPTQNYFSWTKIVDEPGPPVPAQFPGTTTWHGTATSLDAKSWINLQDNAFFAYVCFNPPHTPLQVPPLALVSDETRTELNCWGFVQGNEVLPTDPVQKKRLFYKAMLEAVDTEIGNLLDGITPGKLANTMIFVIGDNGTPGNVMNIPPHTASHAKASVHEWGVRVPLIVSGPLVPTPGGFVTDVPVGAVDLWRTIAAITGANPNLAAPGVTIDSVSFLPVILDPLNHPGTRQYAFSQYFSPNMNPPPSNNDCFGHHRRSISDGSYKYIRTQVVESPIDCDETNYTHEFYRIGESHEETIDFLANGAWTPGAWATYQAMTAEMDAVSQP